MGEQEKASNVAASSLPGSQAATEVELEQNDRASVASSAIIDVEEYCKYTRVANEGLKTSANKHTQSKDRWSTITRNGLPSYDSEAASSQR